MPKWLTVMLGTLVAFGGVGSVAVATNPEPDRYTDFVGLMLKDKCRQIGIESGILGNSPSLSLGSLGANAIADRACDMVVSASFDYIRPEIQRGTQRHNYLLFSIYKTEVDRPFQSGEKVRVETIGVFSNFYPYKTPSQ
jgi:hypothetical protein